MNGMSHPLLEMDGSILISRLLEGKGQMVPYLASRPYSAWNGGKVCQDVAEVLEGERGAEGRGLGGFLVLGTWF
jgi:hypothetical protein